MDTIDKKKNNKDIIEIFIKNKIGIPLNESELKLYNNLDEEEKKIIYELISSKSFLEDCTRIIDNILTDDNNFNKYDSSKDEDTILKNIVK